MFAIMRSVLAACTILACMSNLAAAFSGRMPPGAHYRVALIRHGESEWNKENRFIGWEDVPLTNVGIAEAQNAASIFKNEGYQFDIVYTSYLKRAIKSAWTIMAGMDTHHVPVEPCWQLNEQMYGNLTGWNKYEMIERFGFEKVQKWRRSYDEAPPAVTSFEGYFPPRDRKYKDLTDADVPDSWCGASGTESLKDTQARSWNLWKRQVLPNIKSGKSVLICAHSNVIRAMVKRLDRIPNEHMAKIDFPRAMPLIYYLDENGSPVKSLTPACEWMSGEFLGDVQKALGFEKKQLKFKAEAHRTRSFLVGDTA